MIIRVQLRRGTAAAWTAANPTLAAGEMGLETDTHLVKVGDGTTAWTSLAYSVSDAIAIAAAISAAGAETTPADAWLFPTIVTGVLKKITWANIKAVFALTETPSGSENKSGAAVAPDFANSRTLTWSLTGNITSFALATNLPAQACKVRITLNGYTLPSTVPSGATKYAWTVTGPIVCLFIEAAPSSGQDWWADSGITA